MTLYEKIRCFIFNRKSYGHGDALLLRGRKIECDFWIRKDIKKNMSFGGIREKKINFVLK